MKITPRVYLRGPGSPGHRRDPEDKGEFIHRRVWALVNLRECRRFPVSSGFPGFTLHLASLWPSCSQSGSVCPSMQRRPLSKALSGATWKRSPRPPHPSQSWQLGVPSNIAPWASCLPPPGESSVGGALHPARHLSYHALGNAFVK